MSKHQNALEILNKNLTNYLRISQDYLPKIEKQAAIVAGGCFYLFGCERNSDPKKAQDALAEGDLARSLETWTQEMAALVKRCPITQETGLQESD